MNIYRNSIKINHPDLKRKGIAFWVVKNLNKRKKVVRKSNQEKGFSMMELIIVMAITLILLSAITTVFSAAMRVRDRDSSRTDALTAAQAAINVMSREIANSGFGLTKNNGIVTADSGGQKIHMRNNVVNSNLVTSDEAEDITYYYDSASQSVVRYDANTKTASAVINQISNVSFIYYDYIDSSSTASNGTTTPTANTGRVRITLTIILPDVAGQPKNQTVVFTSDVTLRNSIYMLRNY